MSPLAMPLTVVAPQGIVPLVATKLVFGTAKLKPTVLWVVPFPSVQVMFGATPFVVLAEQAEPLW